MDSKDTFNETVSTILERKVRGWLSGVIDDMRRSSPVQQWLDSLPNDDNTQLETNIDNTLIDNKSDGDPESENKAEETITDNTVIETHNDIQEDRSLEVPVQKEWKRNSLEGGVLNAQPKITNLKLHRERSIQSEGCSPRMKNPLLRDHSLQSDASGSSGSSVLNVLGARKVDAESVLLALGFGPSEKQQKLQRIPDRFLVPSKLKGISTEQFIKNEHHSMKMHDCGVFGYRGLTDHCTPVCRFMKPVATNYHGPYQVPQIAVQVIKISGNPHVPPSTIVAKIIDCLLQDEMCREEALTRTRHSIADMRSAPAIHAHLAARLHSA